MFSITDLYHMQVIDPPLHRSPTPGTYIQMYMYYLVYTSLPIPNIEPPGLYSHFSFYDISQI